MLNVFGEKSVVFGRSIKIFALLAATYSGWAKADVTTETEAPAIPGYGKIHAVNEKKSPYVVSPQAISKFVFQISQATPNPKAVHPQLEKVARAINLMVADGVPTDHMNIVVLIGGPAADAAMNNVHYRTVFGIENPNADLLNKLHKVGVSIVVSDQALAAKNVDSRVLVDFASTALSSFTAITSLVQAGYNVASL